MSPELKIISYIIFIVCLFLIKSVAVYLFIFAAIFVILLRIPSKHLKRGLIPICLFLLFTFLSNILFQHGKILYSLGPVIITEEGLYIASIRTMRVFFMIAGAKIFTANTPLDVLIGAMGNILRPLERFKIPVKDFFSTMGLTLRCFPKLKDHVSNLYREYIKNRNVKGFWGRVRIIASFLMPLFIESMQSPEAFFEEADERKG